MKKLLFTVCVVCLSTGVFAQLSGGLKAGLNLASLKQEAGGESDSEGGTSFHIGAFANFGLSDALQLQPELLYNSIDIDGDKLNYISIPVMFLYGFSDNKFNVQAGPEIGLLMGTDPSEIKDEDFVTGTNFTLNLGAGANFGKFGVTARYGIGLANIAGDYLTDLSDDYKMKLSNFQISVQYRLIGE
ncbi:MAG TPA: porin family protein [Cyclobacteriaceae bacterium]|nr:porin family protein [Cyclobacteriaceae bacterium]